MNQLRLARDICPCFDNTRKSLARAIFLYSSGGGKVNDAMQKELDIVASTDPNSSDILLNVLALRLVAGQPVDDLKEQLKKLRVDVK